MAHVILKDLAPLDYADALENLQRGDVVMVEFPGETPEMIGPHTAVIVSNGVINAEGRTVTVVAISSHGGGAKPKAYEVPLKAGDGELERDCYALPQIVNAIARRRIVQIWGTLSEGAMTAIEDQLAWAQGITFDDV